MSTAAMSGPVAEISPQCLARLAGIFYTLNVVTSLMAFNGVGGPRPASVAGVVATVCYIAVTVLFYKLFRPVNKTVSLIAGAFSLIGCLPGILSPFHIKPYPISSLVFFGVYCLLIGYLILNSTFLPRTFGVLMVFAGLGWLTFISPSLAKTLSPYNYYPGGIGEILFCLWLLLMGVNSERWKEQAHSVRKGSI